MALTTDTSDPSLDIVIETETDGGSFQSPDPFSIDVCGIARLNTIIADDYSPPVNGTVVITAAVGRLSLRGLTRPGDASTVAPSG